MLYNLDLQRHDYNKPQRGKDQCEKESTTAQHFRTAYINAGNDIQNASNTKKSLLYMEVSKMQKEQLSQLMSQ